MQPPAFVAFRVLGCAILLVLIPVQSGQPLSHCTTRAVILGLMENGPLALRHYHAQPLFVRDGSAFCRTAGDRELCHLAHSLVTLWLCVC